MNRNATPEHERPLLHGLFPVPRRHRWRRRLGVGVASLLALTLLATGGVALYLHSWYSSIDRVTITHADAPPGPGAVGGLSPGPGPVGSTNILLTGSDGRACIDPKSPYAGAFLGKGVDTGARSDTILVLHLDDVAKQMALLSFPRDLWVTTAAGGHDRINAAFKADDPSPLIQELEANFGVRIDHYIGVDFCAFKSLVDAVGGLSIPFEAPARDSHTGLAVAVAGCHAMGGDEALAYVRSRYYESKVNGRWVSDPSSDFGRIARQQDFMRRLAAKAISAGATNPLTAKHLLDAAKNSNVRIDDGLGLTDLLRIARSVKDLGPASATSYRVEGHAEVIRGGSVIVPDLATPSSLAMLALFRGLPAPAASPAPAGAAAPAVPAAVAAASNMTGVAPPADQACP